MNSSVKMFKVLKKGNEFLVQINLSILYGQVKMAMYEYADNITIYHSLIKLFSISKYVLLNIKILFFLFMLCREIIGALHTKIGSYCIKAIL